jgi:hypothetical protein
MVTINYHHDNNTSGITFFSEENKKKERSLDGQVEMNGDNIAM